MEQTWIPKTLYPKNRPDPMLTISSKISAPKTRPRRCGAAQDRQFAENVKMCLQENGIGCVIDDSSPTVPELAGLPDARGSSA